MDEDTEDETAVLVRKFSTAVGLKEGDAEEELRPGGKETDVERSDIESEARGSETEDGPAPLHSPTVPRWSSRSTAGVYASPCHLPRVAVSPHGLESETEDELALSPAPPPVVRRSSRSMAGVHSNPFHLPRSAVPGRGGRARAQAVAQINSLWLGTLRDILSTLIDNLNSTVG